MAYNILDIYLIVTCEKPNIALCFELSDDLFNLHSLSGNAFYPGFSLLMPVLVVWHSGISSAFVFCFRFQLV